MFKAMIIKDLKKFSASLKLYLFTLLIFPILLSFLYGALYGNQVNPDRNLTKVKIAFIDEDKSTYSKGIEKVFKSEKIKEFISTDYEGSLKRVENSLKKGDISAAVVVPKGFSESIKEGKKIDIKLLKALASNGETEIVYGIINSYLEVINNNSAVIKTLKENVQDSKKVNFMMESLVNDSVKLSTDNYAKVTGVKLNKKISAREYYTASMLAFIGYYIAVVSAVIMVSEVQAGTMNRIMSTTMSYFGVYAEKLALAIFITVSFTLAYVAITYFLGTVWSTNLLELAFVIAVHDFALVGITALIMNLFKKTKFLSMICMAVTLVLAFMGGSFYYIDENLYSVSFMKYSLNYWITKAYTNLMLGKDIASIIPNIEIIFGVGAVTLLLGTLIASRRNRVYG